MVRLLDSPDAVAAVSEELAALAARARRSVVVVRASRFGAGAGVVWNDQGLIITNDHVIAGPADRQGVVLDDSTVSVESRPGDRFIARIVARSPALDLAALQVEGDVASDRLPPAPIGDSTRLRVGELVVAVGNPLGERQAVTLGILSGQGAVEWAGQRRQVLQVGITLRPGSSGGALVDVRGRVVGIPYLVVGPGQALAVPSAVVEWFLRRVPDGPDHRGGPPGRVVI